MSKLGTTHTKTNSGGLGGPSVHAQVEGENSTFKGLRKPFRAPEEMAGKVAPKPKDKATPEKAKKVPPAANGSAGLLSNAYNPLSGTFHSMDSGPPEAQENGGLNMFEGGGDASDSDSDDEKDDVGGEERRTGAGTLKDKESRADKRDREKMRLRNEKKHQRQKERRAQELKEKCLSLLTTRKVETLALQLEAMGFPKDQAVKAVTMHGGNLERGVSWLLEAGPEVATTSVDPGQAKVDIADELARVVDAELKYGISRGEVERVVVANGGDLDRAMEALATQHPVQLVGSRPDASQTGGAPNGVPREQGGGGARPPPAPAAQNSTPGARGGGGQQAQAGRTSPHASAPNGPGNAGWAPNPAASPGPSWGTPPSANAARQTWQGGQQPPPSPAFTPPFQPPNGSPNLSTKQRPEAPNPASSSNQLFQGGGLNRLADPPLARHAYPPETVRQDAPAQQRLPYQPYPYRPQTGGPQAQQPQQASLPPPQMSRLQGSRPGGILPSQQLRQFLPPQNALQPPSFSQQHLQQLQWQQQQQKGVLSSQGSFPPGASNSQALFNRPNLRGYGPTQAGGQDFRGLDPPKLSSSLSAAAAPWPGGQMGGSGGPAHHQISPRGVPPLNSLVRQGSSSVAPIGPPQSPSSSSSPHSRGSSSPQAAGGAFGSPIWPPSSNTPPSSILSPTSATWGGLGPGLGTSTGLSLSGSSIDWSLRPSADRPKSGGGAVDWSLPGVSATSGVDWSLGGGSGGASSAFGSSAGTIGSRSGFGGASSLSSIWSNDRPSSGGSAGGLGLGGLGGPSASAGLWSQGELGSGKELGSDMWASSSGMPKGKESSGWETPFGGKDLFRGEEKGSAALGLGNSEQDASAAALLNNLSLQ